MKYSLREISKDALDWTLETMIWRFMSLREKEDVARYFLSNYDTPRQIADIFIGDEKGA